MVLSNWTSIGTQKMNLSLKVTLPIKNELKMDYELIVKHKLYNF